MVWPSALPVVQVRVARPTDRLAEVIRFYHEGLGLAIVDRFDDHAGYSGVMLGLPDVGYHLEFTTHTDGSPSPAPTADNLLVLYIPDETAVTALVNRLQSLGYGPVAPENPYWAGQAITIADPDGWRVVLFVGSGLDGVAYRAGGAASDGGAVVARAGAPVPEEGPGGIPC